MKKLYIKNPDLKLSLHPKDYILLATLSDLELLENQIKKVQQDMANDATPEKLLLNQQEYINASRLIHRGFQMRKHLNQTLIHKFN